MREREREREREDGNDEEEEERDVSAMSRKFDERRQRRNVVVGV